MTFFDDLARTFGSRAAAGVPLAPFTTFLVGGPAEYLVEARSSEEILQALRLAAAHGVPVTLLGGGSNVLVSDRGVKGLVIRPRGGRIETAAPGVVRADAGVTINGLVRWTIARGLAGLEAWAGTPGTVGGAVHGNAHFQGRLLGETIVGVRLATRAGEAFEVPACEMDFGYDRSRLQRTGEVLLSADFAMTPGSPDELRRVARASLAYRKRTQPLHLPSAGCVFQNPLPSDPVPDGVPRSAGALLERAGLKGARQGRARVSPLHANFIVNEGGATASDIRALVERCREAVRARFGVELRDEIVYLGEF